jgi:Formyl transferase
LHLLYQIKVGWLDAEVVAIVSNHEDSRRTAEFEGIPFHLLPVERDKSNKAAQEEQVIKLFNDTGADLIVLARYMQILGDKFATRLYGRSSTSTTRSCPRSRAPSPITRRMSAASRSSAPPPTTSPPTSTRVRSSSRKRRASPTP